jgi:hypothetical protein
MAASICDVRFTPENGHSSPTRALRANEFVDIEVEYLTFGASAIVSAKNTYPSRDAL